MKLSTIIIPILFLPLVAAAQTNSVFEMDPAVTVGNLPNGASFYLVTNTVEKGYADFAIVQRDFKDVRAAREALTSLDNFRDTPPYRFLASKGVGPGRDGIVSYRGGSTVFTFRDVPTFDTSAADSTLLLLFDIMRTCPVKQAVIVSGDISAAKVMDRLSMLSMTVPRLSDPSAKEPYSWNPQTSMTVRTEESRIPGVVSISVSYTSPRTPRGMMSSLQPIVADLMGNELEIILRARVREAFRSVQLPLGRIVTRRIDSSRSPSDESFTMTVYTASSAAASALDIVAGVVSGLDARGATMPELQDARDRVVSQSRKHTGDLPASNGDYVERCISAYLYGASLCSGKSVNEFFAKRRLSSEKELGYFNNYVSALFDSERALTLTVAGSSLSESEIRTTFRTAWERVAADSTSRDYTPSYGDTLHFVVPRTRVKVRTTVADPITGGKVWTFSNGMKVVYRKTGAPGKFDYALLLRGGYTSVPKLGDGEGPFVGDMLKISRVAGMKTDKFIAMLRANGIEMQTGATISDLRITGKAPDDKLQLLLKTLLAMGSASPATQDEFETYRRNEAVRLACERYSENGLLNVVDSILTPDYRYRTYKNIDCLKADLPARAAKYFALQFSKVDDGALIIAGDFDENDLQKTLGRYLGGFAVSRNAAVRPRLNRGLREGWPTVSGVAEDAPMGDGRPEIVVAIPLVRPFTMKGYMTMEVAKEALRGAVVEAVAPYGMSVDVYDRREFHPVEMSTLYILCRPCPADGIADVPDAGNMVRALSAVRMALTRMSASPMMDIAGYKAALKNRMDSRYSRPEELVDAAVCRFSMGKDIVSRYAVNIDEVSEEAVREVLSSLDGGTKVEYTLR